MERISFDELETADLVIDRIYSGGKIGNTSDEPLPRLLKVSNQGGFRYWGSKIAPKLIVLVSSFNDPDWPDSIDEESGTLIYFGDNKHPGRELHDTRRFGNFLLREIFNLAHGSQEQRRRVPPILVFAKSGSGRDVIFKGLVVPGSPNIRPPEDLVAIWKVSEGKRYQNYKAIFTILNADKISRQWLEQIKASNSVSSECPVAWHKWAETGKYEPLRAAKAVEFRKKKEQLPQSTADLQLIKLIYQHFKDNPVAFEKCAAELARIYDPHIIHYNLTRPSRDGGRDAIGLYRIGQGASSITVDFALEAKCYNLNNSVGVKETSRLISRLRHRQFGILVTTSFLNEQAYKEIKDDQHPIVIITAVDIIAILKSAGVSTAQAVLHWLESEGLQNGS